MSFKSAFTLALATVLWLGGCATQTPPAPPALMVSAPADGPVEGAAAPAPGQPQAPDVVEAPRGQEIERGRASWYGARFHGRRTASGELFNMNDFTAAHKTLPFGTRLRVRNHATGEEVAVRVNDRGPHIGGRIIDLSRAAAARIGVLRNGTATVVLLSD